MMDSAGFCYSAENLSLSRCGVETYISPEQMTTDTTSKHITDYHRKNDRIKDVSIGFEPPSWDVAGWVENLGRWRGLLTFVIDFYALYLLGALLAHTASSPRLRQAPSQCRRHLNARTPTLPILLPPHPWKLKNRCPGAVQQVWISSDEAH